MVGPCAGGACFFRLFPSSPNWRGFAVALGADREKVPVFCVEYWMICVFNQRPLCYKSLLACHTVFFLFQSPLLSKTYLGLELCNFFSKLALEKALYFHGYVRIIIVEKVFVLSINTSSCL